MFEIIGEMGRSDPTGTIETPPVGGRPPVAWITLPKFVFTLAVFVAAPLIAIFADPAEPQPWLGVGVAAGLFVYAVVGVVLRPAPNHGNMGLFYGLIDHPFRISDDANRFLLFLRIALLPGRFLGYGVIDVFSLLAGEHDDDVPWGDLR